MIGIISSFNLSHPRGCHGFQAQVAPSLRLLPLRITSETFSRHLVPRQATVTRIATPNPAIPVTVAMFHAFLQSRGQETTSVTRIPAPTSL